MNVHQIGWSKLTVRGWVAAGLLLAGSWVAAAPEAPAAIRFGWSDSTFEETIVTAEKAAGGKLSFLADSYRADRLRETQAEFEGSVAEVVSRVARAYKRQIIQRHGVYLLRHGQWFDPGFAAARPADPHGKAPPQQLTLHREMVEGTARLTLDCRGAALSSLATQLGRTTEEPHRVAWALRSRRVSGKVKNSTPEELRALITELFADSIWRRRDTGWSLEERSSAELARLMAKEGLGHGSPARSALYTQAAAALTSDQLQQLRETGTVQINWMQLPPPARDLLVRWADLMHGMIARSSGRTDLFLDPNQKDRWGVEFVTRPDGAIHPRAFGPSLAGPRAIF